MGFLFFFLYSYSTNHQHWILDFLILQFFSWVCSKKLQKYIFKREKKKKDNKLYNTKNEKIIAASIDLSSVQKYNSTIEKYKMNM